MSLYPQRYDRAFVITYSGSAGWAKAQMADITSALRFIGINAIQLDYDEAIPTLQPLRRDSYFIVDANNRVTSNRPFRKISFMVDHPCQVLKWLSGIDQQTVTLAWVDASHVEGVAAIGIPVHSVFLPHAGPDISQNRIPMCDRDIDVLFAGGLGEPIDRSAWLARRSDVSETLADVIFDTAALIETTLDPVLNVFATVCAQRGLKIGEAFSREAFCAVVGEIIRIAEVNQRNAILEALPNIKICVVSDYMPLKFRDRRNIRYQNYTDDFSTIRQLMARSKLILNSTCKFPRGSHERIWYGMAEGAAVLTDASMFMQHCFKHDESIFFLPQRKIVQRDLAYLQGLAEDPKGLSEIAQTGLELYARQHTWKHRISILNDAVQRQPPGLAV